MNRRSFLWSSAALVAMGVLGPGDSHADNIHSHTVPAASLMTECANRFLAALDAQQRAKATFTFDTDERLNWDFVPRERKRVPLREMTPYQQASRQRSSCSRIEPNGVYQCRDDHEP